MLKRLFKRGPNVRLKVLGAPDVFLDEASVWRPPETILFQSDVTLRTHVSPLLNLISCLQGQQRKIGDAIILR